MRSITSIGVDDFKDASSDNEDIDSLRLEFKRLVELSPKSKENKFGEKVGVFWTKEGSKTVNFDLGCDVIESVDEYGNTLHTIHVKFVNENYVFV